MNHRNMPDSLREFHAFLDDAFDYIFDDAVLAKDTSGVWQTNEEWDLSVEIYWVLDGNPTNDDRECVLDRTAKYLDGRSDVKDGDYGIPEANRAMSILHGLDDARAVIALAVEKDAEREGEHGSK